MNWANVFYLFGSLCFLIGTLINMLRSGGGKEWKSM